MLPGIVQELVCLIGEAEALRLVKVVGGQALFFPTIGDKPAYLAEVLTEGAWLKLCHRFGGGYVYIPKCHRTMLLQRNQWIRQARADGKSIRDLVCLTGLTDRQLITICGGSDSGEALQMDLLSDDT